LVIALAAAIWAPWKAGNIPGDVARFAIVLPKDRALASDFNPVIAISPDGQRIVFRASGKLYQRRLGRLDVEPILGTEAATSPFFSPDGRWLGFFAEGHLKKVPLMGGAPVTLADAPGNRGATWCSDGTIVFTPNGRGGLLRVKEDGTSLRQLTVPDTMRNERTHRYPQFLPDGKTVIFTVGTLDSPDYYDDATIGAVNLQTGERTVLLKGACMARYVSSGCLVYSRAGTLFAVPFDLRRLQVSGSSFPVAEDVFGDPTTGATHCSISENGTLVYVPGKANIYQRTLAWVDRNGAVTDLRAAARTYLDPRLSPDGNQVAVIISSGRDFDVWVFNIPRNTMSRLTFGGSNRSPVWSPDGKRIAYSYNATGNSKIIVRQADGSGTPEEFKSGLEEYDRTYVNCWTPDGSMLVVTVPQRRIGWDLMVLPLTGGRKPWKFLSTKSDEWVASLSPNGKWLAYISNETGVSQVFVRPFPGGTGQWQISADQAFETHWSIDGKMLYYNTGHSIMAVPIEATQSLVAGQASVLLKDYRPLSIESGITFDVSPDGLHLLVTKSQDTEEAPLQIDVVLNWTDEISKVVASTK
jgi:serine/threonine-protein kinase